MEDQQNKNVYSFLSLSRFKLDNDDDHNTTMAN